MTKNKIPTDEEIVRSPHNANKIKAIWDHGDFKLMMEKVVLLDMLAQARTAGREEEREEEKKYSNICQACKLTFFTNIKETGTKICLSCSGYCSNF